MKYIRQLHFTLHDYKTRKKDRKLMSRFIAAHKKIGSTYYIDTIEFLLNEFEKVYSNE